MDFTGLTTLTGQEVNPFIKNYREALESQREAALTQLDQERANQQEAIMSQANTAGMLYSNFPARTKIQYDTQTYYPQMAKVNTAYQTGLDTLRNNATNYLNTIRQYQEKIADLNAA